MRTIRLSLMLMVLCLYGIPALAQEQATIEAFTPQGALKAVRQATARFSAPMVALGDPRLADPFSVTCAHKGAGRWVDQRTWVYDFDNDVPAGEVCEFRLKDGVRTLAGQEIAGEKVFRFNTGGPSIVEANPNEGARIDEGQVFVLTLDTQAAAIEQFAYFSVKGIRERVGVRILAGAARAAVLKSVRMRDRPNIVVLQARQSFPAAAEVRLVWGKGIRSRTGVAAAQDQVLAFETRAPFTAACECERERAGAPCIPLLPVRVRFSEEVSAPYARAITLTGAGQSWKPRFTGDAVTSVRFDGPFPEKAVLTLALPKDIRDATGRRLRGARFPQTVKMGRYPALAKFSDRFGIIERSDPILPVTVRNIEAPTTIAAKRLFRLYRVPGDEAAVIDWLKRVGYAARETSVLAHTPGARPVALPRLADAKAFQVVGVPLPGPGFYVAEVESSILGAQLLPKPAPLYVPTTALVTNLAVHFKWGRDNSLVWVTTLDKGYLVKDAAVSLWTCTGKVLWQGRTDSRGIAVIDQALPERYDLPNCYGKDSIAASPALDGIQQGIFVFARAGADMSFSHSSWQQGIEPWRFQLSEGEYHARGIVAHTILDRTLLRAGETVHMRHLVRRQTHTGLAFVPAEALPDLVKIEHQGSGQEYRLPLVWKAGAAAGEWRIPERASLGTYAITLIKRTKDKKGNDDEQSWPTGEFSVQEFRVPLMKAVVAPPAGPLVRPGAVDVDLAAYFLSGGGASHRPVKLRAEVREHALTFPGYEGYTFQGGKYTEGIVKRATDFVYYGYDGGDELGQASVFKLPTQDLTLDGTGNLRARLKGLPAIEVPKLVHTEMEYRDPSGEVQTATADIPVYPARRLVGLSTENWSSAEKVLKYRAVVLDLKGRPVKDAPVTVDLYRQIVHTHRVRLVGGYYGYQSTYEIKRLGRYFSGKTDRFGRLFCEGASPVSGEVILHAEVKDAAGNIATANSSLWVAGRDEWWFAPANDDRIDVLPEQTAYEPGQTARFQVRMPFRRATALVTVEREGIIDSSVWTLSGTRPVITIPIKPGYAPNVYVSVLVVRGRVGGTQPTATFDPGRPAYRFGIGEIAVGWKGHALKVEVLPEKQVYQVRETMQVRIRVRTADGGAPPAAGEVAVAAVDEGLLALKPNASWKLLPVMMQKRGYQVETSTAQAMVVGKRHFGLKALPHGGGGGKMGTRELFDTLLYWNGRVALDTQGEAVLSIPLNDSLTGFTIAAIATAGADRFGTGESSVRTSQDLMLVSGLPQLVREGDAYTAGATVKNATTRAMEVEASLAYHAGQGEKELTPVRLRLAPGEAREIGWAMRVPYDTEKIAYRLGTREIGGPAADRLQVSQRVARAVPVRVLQAALAQVQDTLTVPVAKPADAVPGGGIAVLLKPRIADTLPGVQRYMREYPFSCLEQRVSRAVALRDKAMWEGILKVMPAYLDRDGLLKYFPSPRLQGSDCLSAYVLAVAHQAGYEIPPYLRGRISDGLKSFVEGRVVRRGALPTADLAIRKLAAIEALSRYEKIDPQFLSSIAITPNLWPTSALIDWIQILLRTDMPERSARLAEAQQILRSRLALQGTTMGFSTERMDDLWWLMVSGDANAARVLLVGLEIKAWREDIPRLTRGLLGRLERGRWDTTVANAWGVLALEAFSRTFESVPVSGTTNAALAGTRETVDWQAAPKGRDLLFPWPAAASSLQVRHTGGGAPWVTLQSLAAVPLKAPLTAGYAVRKTLTPVEQKVKGRWTRGDVVRVRLDIRSQADMTWVVVSDPIPAGAAVIQPDLGGSQILTAAEQNGGGAWEAYTERSYEAWRRYYGYAAKGAWSAEYTLRLNNDGRFLLPPTRVEALYAPEMFGEAPNDPIEVQAP